MNGSNKLIQSEEELNQWRIDLMKERRDFTKSQRNEKINNTKLKTSQLDPIDDPDEYIEDDNALYKRRSIDAIKKDGGVYKVPKTSRKDTDKIFKQVSKNKDTITKLIKSKDNDEFNSITRDNIKDEKTMRIFEQHRDNDLVVDRTWTKNDFINYMDKLRKGSESKSRILSRPDTPSHPPNPQDLRRMESYRRLPAGLNPGLFVRK